MRSDTAAGWVRSVAPLAGIVWLAWFAWNVWPTRYQIITRENPGVLFRYDHFNGTAERWDRADARWEPYRGIRQP